MDPNSSAWLLMCILLTLLVITFWSPTLIAFIKRHPHRWWILIFNTIIGGSGIGWLVALLWSLGVLFPNSKK